MLDGVCTAHVNTYGGVEFQCAAACCRFRIAVGDADLFAQLVDEDGNGTGLTDDAREFAHRLAHQTCLETDDGRSHVALNLRLWNECRDGVYHDDVDGTAVYKRIHDLKCLLARIRLGNEEILGVDPQFASILRIERVLCIDKCGKSSCLLCLCNHVEGDGCLTGGFGAVNLDDASARDASNAKGNIERQDAGRYHLNIHICLGFAKTHDRALAMIFLDLLERVFQCLFARHGLVAFAVLLVLLRHIIRSFNMLFSFQLYENPRTFVKRNVRGVYDIRTFISEESGQFHSRVFRRHDP